MVKIPWRRAIDRIWELKEFNSIYKYKSNTESIDILKKIYKSIKNNCHTSMTQLNISEDARDIAVEKSDIAKGEVQILYR